MRGTLTSPVAGTHTLRLGALPRSLRKLPARTLVRRGAWPCLESQCMRAQLGHPTALGFDRDTAGMVLTGGRRRL